LIKIIIKEENFKWHLEAFASELFIYIYIYIYILLISSSLYDYSSFIIQSSA